MDLWQVLKDVLLTGTGLALILSQLFSNKPQDVLLVTGLALTVPSVAGHAGALLQGHGDSHSSPPSPPHGPPRSAPSPQGAADE